VASAPATAARTIHQRNFFTSEVPVTAVWSAVRISFSSNITP